MNRHIPEVITLKAESSTRFGYDNHPIATINDHVVRIATMTVTGIFIQTPTRHFWSLKDGFPLNSRADRSSLILANCLPSLAESVIGPGRLAHDQ
jgi:hypothetical protein